MPFTHDCLRDALATLGGSLTAARWCTTHDTSSGFRDVPLAPVLLLFGLPEVPRG